MQKIYEEGSTAKKIEFSLIPVKKYEWAIVKLSRLKESRHRILLYVTKYTLKK